MKSKGNKYSKVIIYWLFNSSHYCPCSQGTSMVSMCGCNNSLFKAKVITLVVWNWPWWKSLYHEYCQLYKYSSFFFFSKRTLCWIFASTPLAQSYSFLAQSFYRIYTEFLLHLGIVEKIITHCLSPLSVTNNTTVQTV
jgi:hypothetical protein